MIDYHDFYKVRIPVMTALRPYLRRQSAAYSVTAQAGECQETFRSFGSLPFPSRIPVRFRKYFCQLRLYHMDLCYLCLFVMSSGISAVFHKSQRFSTMTETPSGMASTEPSRIPFAKRISSAFRSASARLPAGIM